MKKVLNIICSANVKLFLAKDNRQQIYKLLSHIQFLLIPFEYTFMQTLKQHG